MGSCLPAATPPRPRLSLSTEHFSPLQVRGQAEEAAAHRQVHRVQRLFPPQRVLEDQWPRAGKKPMPQPAQVAPVTCTPVPPVALPLPQRPPSPFSQEQKDLLGRARPYDLTPYVKDASGRIRSGKHLLSVCVVVGSTVFALGRVRVVSVAPFDQQNLVPARSPTARQPSSRRSPLRTMTASLRWSWRSS